MIKKGHPQAEELAIESAGVALANGCAAVFAEESRHVARMAKAKHRVGSRVRVVEKPRMTEAADLIAVFGGDGTYLSIARLMRTRSIPVMGVNMGQLGFLTEIKKEEAIETLQRILRHRSVTVSERILLEVTLRRKNRLVFQGPVVNDAVISKGAIARIIGMCVSLNGKEMNVIRADGLIISTPTGSTAYSLAAGGPIVEPSVPGLVLSPICPHSLTQRPIVVSDDAEISIRLSDRPGHVLLTLDGQDAVDMRENDIVTVRRFKKHALRLVTIPSRDYFSVLREKLHFGSRG